MNLGNKINGFLETKKEIIEDIGVLTENEIIPRINDILPEKYSIKKYYVSKDCGVDFDLYLILFYEDKKVNDIPNKKEYFPDELRESVGDIDPYINNLLEKHKISKIELVPTYAKAMKA